MLVAISIIRIRCIGRVAELRFELVGKRAGVRQSVTGGGKVAYFQDIY